MPEAHRPRHSDHVAAPEEMTRILGVAPDACRSGVGRDGVSLQLWRHGPLHGRTCPMREHVFMTYLGAPRPIHRRSDGRQASGWTRPGAVTLIPAGSESRWDIEGALEAVHLYVPDEVVAAVSEQHGLGRLVLAERTAAEDLHGSRLIGRLLEASQEPSPDRLYWGEVSDLLTIHLIRSHAEGAAPPSDDFRGGLAPAAFRNARAMLDGHLASDIALRDVAQACGLSVFHFCRAFRRTSGVAPFRWRQLRRVEVAIDLIRHSDLSLPEIALRVGYEDQGQLSRLFRKTIGRPPRSFRRGRGLPRLPSDRD